MSDFVKADHVFLGNTAATADEVLEFLAKQAVELGVATDEAAVLAALRAREAQGTTGMQGGFAIPHCKSDAVNASTVLVMKFAQDVEWSSMDGQPIRAAISLLVPEGEAGTTFLKLLSQVAMLLMNVEFRDKMMATDDPEAIAALINEGLN